MFEYRSVRAASISKVGLTACHHRVSTHILARPLGTERTWRIVTTGYVAWETKHIALVPQPASAIHSRHGDSLIADRRHHSTMASLASPVTRKVPLGDRHVEIYPELSFPVLRYDARL